MPSVIEPLGVVAEDVPVPVVKVEEDDDDDDDVGSADEEAVDDDVEPVLLTEGALLDTVVVSVEVEPGAVTVVVDFVVAS